ncbi:MAG: GDSL-type esterase/lipase family protein [Actinomycetota bacterium]
MLHRRFASIPLHLAAAVVVCALALTACDRAGAQRADEPTHAFRTAVPELSTIPAPCPTSSASGGVEVRLFHAPGGGCVRQDQLREFRCTPQDDPVIEAGGLRFLGGAFAMPVSQVPVEARLLGRNSLEEVDIRPGDRPTLFVTTAGGVERWLTLVTPPDGLADALFIGDSIMVGSRRAVVRALPGWATEFRAKVSRTTDEGIDVARTLDDMSRHDVVVVELGTNESLAEGFPARIRRMLSIVGSARLIVWVTVHRDQEITPELNDDIVSAMRDLPNGIVADWNAAVTPDDLLADGVHPTDAGQALMAHLLAGPLQRWNDAATGHGDVACAPPE